MIEILRRRFLGLQGIFSFWKFTVATTSERVSIIALTKFRNGCLQPFPSYFYRGHPWAFNQSQHDCKQHKQLGDRRLIFSLVTQLKLKQTYKKLRLLRFKNVHWLVENSQVVGLKWSHCKYSWRHQCLNGWLTLRETHFDEGDQRCLERFLNMRTEINRCELCWLKFQYPPKS